MSSSDASMPTANTPTTESTSTEPSTSTSAIKRKRPANGTTSLPTSTSTSSSHPTDEQAHKKAKFNVTYAAVPDSQQREKRDNLLAILFPDYNRPPARFYESLPGPLPASVTRGSLRLLQSYQYWVCEKSDGQRCCMYVDSTGAYLIDRKFIFLKLQHDLYTHLWGKNGVTILDGELCSSVEAAHVAASTPQGTSSLAPYLNTPPGTSPPVYMVFDIISLNGDASIQNLKLAQRLGHIGTGIIKPYRAAIAELQKSEHKSDDDTSSSTSLPMLIKAKQFFKTRHIESAVLANIRNDNEGQAEGVSWYIDEKHDVRNQNDGVIFTPDDQNYLHKNNNGQPPLLKWKPNHMNTIDFVIKKPLYDNQNRLQLYCGARHGNQLFDVMIRATEITSQQRQELEYAMQQRDRAVVECAYESDLGSWSIKHIRPDKLQGNFITTVMSTMETIADNVTAEDLIVTCTGQKPTRPSSSSQQHRAR